MGQKGGLTDEELSVLAMMPFMHTTGSRLEIATKAVQIANKLVEEKGDLVIKLMKVMAEKLLCGNDNEQVVQSFDQE